MLAHRLFVTGGWRQDFRQHTVSIADLEVTSIPSQEVVLNANKQGLTDFNHRGRVTCLQVKQWADGNVMVVTGSAQGAVSRMRFRVPLAPGSALDQIQMVDMDTDTDAGFLCTWQQCHTDTIAAVDINAEKQQVLTAGIDGQLHLLPLDWDPGSAASTSQTCYSDQQGYVSYHAAQWSSMDTFVTASTTGGLQVWDTRKRSCRQSDLKWGLTGAPQDIGKGTARQIHSIATHPSQPDKCASGGSNGTVAVWDLRFAAAPVVANAGKQSPGDVWQVQFDTDYESGAAQAPPVLFCTDDGNLCRVDWAGHGAAALNEQPRYNSSSDGCVSVLLTEASSVNGFDVNGTDIVAVVEQECMCYIKRRSQTF
ncbi:hypothetical protein WJX77_012438 [Trebouxia sp. C0004]